MPKTILVTCSDDRQGRKGGQYSKVQERVHKLFWGSGIHHCGWTIQDILREWDYSILREIDPGMNGRVYKPLTILYELSRLDEGDYLIYNDVSPEIWNGVESLEGFDFNVIRDLTDVNGGILTAFVKWDYINIPQYGKGLHLHRYFTLNSCMDKMGLRHHENSYMHASGMMCLRKCDKTMKFVEEWLYWNLDPECSALKNWEQERDFKVGHRHDQSISGLLLNRMNADAIDILHNNMNAYNFLQFCFPKAKYEFIPLNSNPGDRELEFNRIFIRPGSIVENEAGQEMNVYRVDYIAGVETFVVGQHEQSCYATTRDKIKLKV